MKKNTLSALAAALVLLFALGYLSIRGKVPRGQPPLGSLSGPNGFAAFEKAFDDGAGLPRLVLLLSPT